MIGICKLACYACTSFFCQTCQVFIHLFNIPTVFVQAVPNTSYQQSQTLDSTVKLCISFLLTRLIWLALETRLLIFDEDILLKNVWLIDTHGILTWHHQNQLVLSHHILLFVEYCIKCKFIIFFTFIPMIEWFVSAIIQIFSCLKLSTATSDTISLLVLSVVTFSFTIKLPSALLSVSRNIFRILFSFPDRPI